MPTQSRSPEEVSWTKEYAGGFSDPLQLLDALQLSPTDFESTIDLNSNFPLRVPKSFVRRMKKGDPFDPLLRQILPLTREREEVRGYSADPLFEKDIANGPLIHKYYGRVLIITTGTCAINCRYCFRREFPYPEHLLNTDALNKITSYLEEDETVNEVILSGGDPLALTDEKIEPVISRISKIRHVKTLRIHSRLPVTIPVRLTKRLLEILVASQLSIVLVFHINHPREIDTTFTTPLHRYRTSSVTLLNQSVLLKGVNDTAKTLIDLSRKLFATGILPYYLHLLDQVSGAASFEVTETDPAMLLREMLEALPGYLVPRVVREKAGLTFKLPISCSYSLQKDSIHP